MRQTILLLASALFIPALAYSQNIGINDDGSAADPSAMLDVKASDKGLLIPRVALDDAATAAPITSPAEGLLIYNQGGSEPSGFYFWDGSAWQAVGSGSGSPSSSSDTLSVMADADFDTRIEVEQDTDEDSIRHSWRNGKLRHVARQD